MNKIDKRHLCISKIGCDVSLPFGRWYSSVDELFVLRWKEDYCPYDIDGEEDKKGWIAFLGIDFEGRKLTPVVHYSYMKKAYRGKGLGSYLYDSAIKYYGELGTMYSGNPHIGGVSDDAIRVWERLKRKYEHKRIKGGIKCLAM